MKMDQPFSRPIFRPNIRSISTRLSAGSQSTMKENPISGTIQAEQLAFKSNALTPSAVPSQEEQQYFLIQTAAMHKMSPHTAKIKCRLYIFLSNFLQLTMEDKPQSMVAMQSLVQALIDGKLKPPKFMSKTSQELKAAPVTGLEVFLKNSLPYLRLALSSGELEMNGIIRPAWASILAPSSTNVKRLAGKKKKTNCLHSATSESTNSARNRHFPMVNQTSTCDHLISVHSPSGVDDLLQSFESDPLFEELCFNSPMTC